MRCNSVECGDVNWHDLGWQSVAMRPELGDQFWEGLEVRRDRKVKVRRMRFRVTADWTEGIRRHYYDRTPQGWVTRTKMNAIDMLDVSRGVWRTSVWPCSKVLWGQWVERKGGRNFAFCLSSTAGRESNALRRPYGWWLSLANWANLKRMKNRQRLSASDREKLWAMWKEEGSWAETECCSSAGPGIPSQRTKGSFMTQEVVVCKDRFPG